VFFFASVGWAFPSLMIGTLQYVFEDNLHMGTGHAGAVAQFGVLCQDEIHLDGCSPCGINYSGC